MIRARHPQERSDPLLSTLTQTMDSACCAVTSTSGQLRQGGPMRTHPTHKREYTGRSPGHRRRNVEMHRVTATDLAAAACRGGLRPHEAQGVADHRRLDRDVQRRVRLERRRVVDLHEPWPCRRVQQQVVAEDLRGTAGVTCLRALSSAPKMTQLTMVWPHDWPVSEMQDKNLNALHPMQNSVTRHSTNSVWLGGSGRNFGRRGVWGGGG